MESVFFKGEKTFLVRILDRPIILKYPKFFWYLYLILFLPVFFGEIFMVFWLNTPKSFFNSPYGFPFKW